MTTNPTTPDAALLWAREKYQRRTFQHLTPELAEAFRAGQDHERRADAGLLAALEAAYRRGYDEGAEDALEEGETPHADTQNEGWHNYRAAIAAAKGTDHAE